MSAILRVNQNVMSRNQSTKLELNYAVSDALHMTANTSQQAVI